MRINPHLALKRAPAPPKDDDDDDDDKPVKSTRTRTRTTRTQTTATKTTKTKTTATRTTASKTTKSAATPSVRTRSTAAESTTKPAVKTPAARPSASRAVTTPSTSPKAIIGTPGAASATQALPDPSASSAPEKSSSHALAGVAAAAAAIIGLAIGVWFLRKWFMKRRAAKSTQWRASVHDQFDEKRDAYSDSATNEKDAASLRPLMAAPSTPVETFALPALPPPAGIPESMARPSSVGSAAYSAPPVAPQSPSIAAMNAVVAPIAPSPLSPAGARREAAMVVRPFMPTLADELPVTAGETVFIVEAFDDGWASCTNSRGQSGVVPIECLQSMARKPRDQVLAQQQQGGDWRTSKRVSSLYGGVASGTY